tara:strand:- start:1313 stop:1444 length:132 start_codon:yes stop_codon:yes gene_type:complete
MLCQDAREAQTSQKMWSVVVINAIKEKDMNLGRSGILIKISSI